MSKFPLKSTLSAILLSSTVILGLPQVSHAACSGLTLWSGLEDRNDELPFCWDFGMRSNTTERYRFHIPAEKIPEGVSKIRIDYTQYDRNGNLRGRQYSGRFDYENIDLRISGESLPREALEILGDDEENFVEIGINFEVLEEQEKSNLINALYEGHSLEVVFHNVRNPRFGGMYYFRGAFLPANDDVNLFLDIGTWIVSVGRR